MKNNLSDNLAKLVHKVKILHDDIFLESVKNKNLRKYVLVSKDIMNIMSDVLNSLPYLDELNTNMYICYENNIYLSFIKKKYVVSEIKNDKVRILGYSSNLQKALELFYSKAYNAKKKHLKAIKFEND